MPDLDMKYAKRMSKDEKEVLHRSEYYKLEFTVDTKCDRVWCDYGYILQFKNEKDNWLLY